MIKNLKHILFDLDGTLTDPYLGISRCIVHAIEKMGCSEKLPSDLRWCIGPPLSYSFEEILQTKCSKTTATAVRLYRERFSTIGLFENEIYPGIKELLTELKSQSIEIHLATSKPKVYASQILDHFELSQYFSNAFGSNLDGTLCDKSDLLAHAISTAQIDSQTAIMVGDRRYDIEGGKSHNVTTIAVEYGYGNKEELIEAKPDATASSVADLRALLLGQNNSLKF